MALKKTSAKMLKQARLVLAFLAMMQFSFLGPLADSARADDKHTSTPIKHVIIIVGENRTFDHLFATYQPKPFPSRLSPRAARLVRTTPRRLNTPPTLPEALCSSLAPQQEKLLTPSSPHR